MKICPVCATEYPDDTKFCPNDGQTLRAAAPAADLVGQVIADRYHVLKKLGEGGMGQVYLAEHVKMGRRSAIKVMNPSMVHDPDAVARFNREASNASRITHPNVCAIYDFGETPDGLIYLAMEFIEGEPLTDLLERDGALPLRRAVDIFLQTADALQAAHELGIVHRDLKPDNVMIGRGRSGRDGVKVVDFGIAKAIGGEEAGQKVTKTGLVVGTPEFMSPEQLAGDKLDGRSDLYALALVFFRMLTGTLPFKGDSVQEMMIKRLTDEPAKLATARPDLTFPPGLQAILDTALARTPQDRYQTVAKFAGDVGEVVGFQRRQPRGTEIPKTAAAEAKTQLVDAAAVGSPTRRMTPKAPPQTPPPPTKKRSLVPIAVGVIALLGAGGAAVAVFGGDGEKAQGADTTAVTPTDTGSRNVATRTTERTTGPGRGTRTEGSTGRDTGVRNPENRGPRIDAARAREALDGLLEVLDKATARMVLDSARALFNATQVSKVDRAYAAFLVGSAYSSLGDRPAYCEWVGRSRTLDPGKPAYETAFRDQCQG